MRMVIRASVVLFAIEGSAHAREWCLYNSGSFQYGNRTGSLAWPNAKHEELHTLGIMDSVEVLKGPKINEVIAAMIQVELGPKKEDE